MSEVVQANRVAAIFLDRDGVLNAYLPERYVENPDQLVILPGVAKAIRRINDAGIPVIVISNQQGVGKDIMTMAMLDEVTLALTQRISAEAGARIDAIYYCTHVRGEYCDCRKPKPGMILEACAKFDLRPEDTAFVGDSGTDIEAASAAGVGTKVLVLSGGNKHYRRGLFLAEPDYVFSDLTSFTDWILETQH